MDTDKLIPSAAAAERLAVIETKLDMVLNRMTSIEHAIVGNGKEGLETRTTRLETSGGIMKWILGTLIGGGGLGAILKFFG